MSGEKYHGRPCRKCGGTLRYVAGGACVACRAEYRAENREAIREYDRQYRAAYLEESRERARKWHAERRKKACESAAKRRATKQQQACANIGTPECKAIIAELYAEAQRTGQHVDHYFPLAKGGRHCCKNLRVLPGPENSAKRDAIPEDHEWLAVPGERIWRKD